MKIPKRVNIAGIWYRIRFPYLFKERTDVFGRICFAKDEIFITNVDPAGSICSDSHTARIFLHECLHALDVSYCMNKIGEEDDKEELIDALAKGLNQFLNDNFETLKPKAVCMLRGGKE